MHTHMPYMLMLSNVGGCFNHMQHNNLEHVLRYGIVSVQKPINEDALLSIIFYWMNAVIICIQLLESVRTLSLFTLYPFMRQGDEKKPQR